MAAFRFSRRAEADLLSIGYTLRTWGRAQAARYIGGLEACCQMLADNPALGWLCDDVRPRLRRLEHGKPRAPGLALRDLGLHCRMKLGIFLEVEEAPIARPLGTGY